MAGAKKKYAPGEAPKERIIHAARQLFGSKGFHATTTAELAADAEVSMGQIYRLFTDKDDIVLTIVEENVRSRVAAMNVIFDSVERSELSMFQAMKAIAGFSLDAEDGKLSFEILAEACRNPSVAKRLETLTEFYSAGVRRLAALARPDVAGEELDAYVEIMVACLIGLGHRTAIASSVNVEITSRNTAFLMMRALGLPSEAEEACEACDVTPA